jgi:hypothetical protein
MIYRYKKDLSKKKLIFLPYTDKSMKNSSIACNAGYKFQYQEAAVYPAESEDKVQIVPMYSI